MILQVIVARLLIGFQVIVLEAMLSDALELRSLADQEVTKCEPMDVLPRLHMAIPNNDTLKSYNENFADQYKRHIRLTSGNIRHYDIKAMLETRLTSVMTTDPATFVFWGQTQRGVNELEAYNHINVVQGDFNSMAFTWSFHKPNIWNEQRLIDKTTNLPAANYVAFASFCAGVFAHFITDFIGFVALVRELYPDERTRFLFADFRNQNAERMNILDPMFSKRIDWINCKSLNHCNQKFTVAPGGSLTVVTPHRRLPIRHIELYNMARSWLIPLFNQRNLPDPNAIPLVVYYSRKSENAFHGRALDSQQEAIVLHMLQKAMDNKYLHEKDQSKVPKIHIFDGTEPMERQIQVFQRAKIIVGSHGGGMANLFFAGTDCNSRPKVLEFLVDPTLTPQVQTGGFGKTYHTIMSTAPWVEYHHILYQPPSNEETTFISLHDFHCALSVLFELDPKLSLYK